MKKLSTILFTLVISIFIINSCKKDNNEETQSGSDNTTTVTGTKKTTLAGRVIAENHNPMAGVTVIAYGKIAVTDQLGFFLMEDVNVDANRCVVKFSKNGYFNRTHAFIASGNTVNYLNIVLISNSATQSFSSTTGGTISLVDQSSVTFQANSIVTTAGTAYNGSVNVALKHLSPDHANFGFSIPGGDLLAKNVNGVDVVLYSYGMIGIELTGSAGQALQLAVNTTATLTAPIASSQLATAPATLPLWYFDEATSLWKEQGTANKIGNNYVGTVTHFSWWNYDYPGPIATIKGKVVDCYGDSVPNAIVTIDGWYQIVTDQNGEFIDLWPANTALTAQVLGNFNSGILNSQLENIQALLPNQVFTIPDLIVSCPSKLNGSLKSCTGDNIAGWVYVHIGNIYYYQYAHGGQFSLNVPNNYSLTLYTFNDSAIVSTPVTTPSQGTILNVGNLVLCDTTTVSAIYENGFILNGNGYNNRLFIIDTTSSLNTCCTGCAVYGTDQQTGTTCALVVDFAGINLGYYLFPDSGSGVLVAVSVNGTGSYDYQSRFLPAVGNVHVTRYDPIGGRIEASFSGILADTTGVPVTVSGGKINVARRY